MKKAKSLAIALQTSYYPKHNTNFTSHGSIFCCICPTTNPGETTNEGFVTLLCRSYSGMSRVRVKTVSQDTCVLLSTRRRTPQKDSPQTGPSATLANGLKLRLRKSKLGMLETILLICRHTRDGRGGQSQRHSNTGLRESWLAVNSTE